VPLRWRLVAARAVSISPCYLPAVLGSLFSWFNGIIGLLPITTITPSYVTFVNDTFSQRTRLAFACGMPLRRCCPGYAHCTFADGSPCVRARAFAFRVDDRTCCNITCHSRCFHHLRRAVTFPLPCHYSATAGFGPLVPFALFAGVRRFSCRAADVAYVRFSLRFITILPLRVVVCAFVV
jgi:hypothetical protein